MDLSTIVVCVAFSVMVASYCGNWLTRWRFRHIPGPTPQFPLGNMKTVRQKQIFQAHKDWSSEYGDISKFWLVRKPILLVTDPKVVQQVTIKQFSHFRETFMPIIDSPLLSGAASEGAKSMMIVAKGQLWGSLRAGAQPMFHSANLSTYAGTINKAVDALITKLHTIARSGREVNIFQPLGQMTLQVTGVAAFGVDLECQRDISEEEGMLVSAAKTVFASSAPSLWMLAAMLAPPPLVPLIRGLASVFPGKTLSGLFQAYEALYDVSACLIQNTKRKLNKDDISSSSWVWFKRNPNNPYKDATPSENSIIPTLLRANNKSTGVPLSDLQIAAQTNLIMLAGYETTAVALTYCIYLLSKHPQAQERLLKEADGFKGQPSYEQLDHFPYAAAVLSEALRLFPPASLFSREATQDAQVGPYRVPKGTALHISVYTLHHDERWWQDAEAFKPERWVGDKTGGDRSGGLAYLPFGSGPKMCIGYKLALEEAIIALVRLYQQFTFRLSESCTEPLSLRQSITMSPKEGVPVYVTERHQN